eukprot:scaffold245063_cov23-Tisochrysis_lutea.AAC.4
MASASSSPASRLPPASDWRRPRARTRRRSPRGNFLHLPPAILRRAGVRCRPRPRGGATYPPWASQRQAPCPASDSNGPVVAGRRWGALAFSFGFPPLTLSLPAACSPVLLFYS